MNKRLWSGIVISLFIVAALYFSWHKLGNNNVSAEFISEKEAQTLVQNRYQGTVSQIKLVGHQYQIELAKHDNLYIIKLDAINGKVILFKKTNSITKSPPVVEPPAPPPPLPDPPKRLTEAEAGKIALEQVNGTIDHIWLKTKADITYYLVELKMEDNREAVVQIHAITGNVMSVSWDDQYKSDEIDDHASNRGNDASKEDDD